MALSITPIKSADFKFAEDRRISKTKMFQS
jgi:hypothetical protein